MPLVWAHAEFAKLALSLSRGRPIDRPEAVWLRYEGRRPVAERAHWTRKMPVGTMRAGQSLRFIFDEPTLMHWGLDGWTQPRDASSAPGLLGLHVVDVDPEALAGAERVDFSCQDVGTGRWIETDRRIRIERPS